jgi:ribonuclease J
MLIRPKDVAVDIGEPISQPPDLTWIPRKRSWRPSATPQPRDGLGLKGNEEIPMLRIVPLGGLGEIGLNMMVFECGDSRIVVDAGLMFPEDYMLGVDFVIPDMSYLRPYKSRTQGIVLTHAHEDHIGALPFLLREIDAPVFGTAFTLGLVRQKLEELEVSAPAGLQVISCDQPLSLGSFTLDFIRVGTAWSTVWGSPLAPPKASSCTPAISRSAVPPTEAVRRGQILPCGERGSGPALGLDQHRARGSTLPDSRIGETLGRSWRQAPGRVIVALFASNIGRIQMIVDIARQAGRKVIISGRNIEASARSQEPGISPGARGLEVSMDLVQGLPG